MSNQVKDKRIAIMDAALKLFTERGFHGTSTALISKEAGVSTGSLFNYFATKEELINSLYFEVKSRLSTCIRTGLEPEISFEEQMRKLWSNFIICGVNKPDEFHFIGQFCSSPYITKLTKDEATKEYEFIRTLLEEGFQNANNKNYSVELSLAIFYQSSRAVVNLILNSDHQKDMNEIIEDGFQVLWMGMEPE
jgi:AcrR family transcriptional regulator